MAGVDVVPLDQILVEVLQYQVVVELVEVPLDLVMVGAVDVVEVPLHQLGADVSPYLEELEMTKELLEVPQHQKMMTVEILNLTILVPVVVPQYQEMI